ncbi:MAG TPA: MFS transporter [Anaerolineales bacterium]|nr:MFS transporter [Anaerolineales bacterium]
MQELRKLGQKITLVLFVEQGLASAAFIAAATLNAIVGADLAGNSSVAGVPAAAYLLSGAFAAGGWGVLNESLGRRRALVLGLLIGTLGSGIAFFAISQRSFPAFLAGMLLMGVANAAVQLARFVAADVNPPEARGRAISQVVLGGTVGSIIGPLVTGPAGQVFKALAGNELAGAYAISAVLFLLGAAVVFVGLRPDPRQIGRDLAALLGTSQANGSSNSDQNHRVRSAREIFRQPAAAVALTAMVIGQLVMVLVMVITSLHMKDHNHPLGDISIVIAAHTFGMYAFSIFSGQLADRWGRGPVILTGASTLVLACLAATISPNVLPLGVALFLLGLGWNFCYVGGSTLLADQLSQQERARTQGLNDLLVGLASATGSLSSGLIFASLGYAVMAYVSAALAVIPLSVAALWFRGRVQAPAAAS